MANDIRQSDSSSSVRPQTVWVHSNDRELIDAISGPVARQVGCEVEWASPDDWANTAKSYAADDVCIVDMRDLDTWYTLMQASLSETTKGLRAFPCPIVGILADGYPLEFADLGDHVLSKVVVHYKDVSDWNTLLEAARRDHRATVRNEIVERRVLPGNQHQLLSYTPELLQVIDELEIATMTSYHILVTGETGTGKTTLARLIHDQSPRKDKPFVTVSCGALATELMGSELFGHVRGAFTSADKDKPGKFEVADGGTLVLEEIDTLDAQQQARLLRVIETGEFERVGSNETIQVDVRLIVTSNVELQQYVEEKQFRADLFFRLQQLSFDLPPLRDRKSDIAWLICSLVQEGCRMNQREVATVHPDFMELLRAYAWPGNIRELRNHVHRAVMFCTDGHLSPTCLAPSFLRDAEAAWREASEQDAAALSSSGPAAPQGTGLAQDVQQAEREAIERTLRATGFNRAKAARQLGISRVTLYNKMRKYRIELDDDPRSKPK